jgi:hypothetical protein
MVNQFLTCFKIQKAIVDLFQVIMKLIVVDSENGLVLYHAGYGDVSHADKDFVGLL